MASGVGIDDACKERYIKLKQRKENLKYIIYRLSDDRKKIIIDSEGKEDKKYDDFVNELKAAASQGECRYAVFNAEYVKKDIKKDKVLFFFWAPDNCSIKQKMVYASSKDAFKAAIDNGIQVIQANDDNDLDYKEIEADLIAKDRT